MYKEHRCDPIPEEGIPECCKGPSPDDPTCTDCCYDSWKEELKKVNQRYAQEKEAADALQRKIDFLTDRRNRYKVWVEEILRAEELRRDLCIQLDVIITQSHKIWFNTCKAREAVEILFCMIYDFFLEVDYIKCRYDEIWNCIINNTDPSLQEDKGIRACLKSYAEKLDAVIKAKDDLIKLIVAAVKFAEVMRNSLNTAKCLNDDYNACADDGPKCEIQKEGSYVYGFKSIICAWYKSLKCDEQCGSTSTGGGTNYNQGQQTYQGGGGTGGGPIDPCEVSCELDPQFDLPFCNDPYKGCVQKWFDQDQKDIDQFTKDVAVLNKRKEGSLACKQSLTKAMEEADPKLRCK